jgi:hypothetical protein
MAILARESSLYVVSPYNDKTVRGIESTESAAGESLG